MIYIRCIHTCTYAHSWSHPHTYTQHIHAHDMQGPLSSGTIAGVVLGGLVFLIVLAVITACVCALVYSYRHPTSKIGLFMIEVCLYDVCVCTEQYVKSVRFANRHAHNFSTITSVAGQKVCFILSTGKIPQQ